MGMYVKAPSLLLGYSFLHLYAQAPQEPGAFILFPEFSCVHLCAICLFFFFSASHVLRGWPLLGSGLDLQLPKPLGGTRAINSQQSSSAGLC